MRRLLEARPRFPERVWLVLIIPLLWLIVLASDQPPSPPAPDVHKAGKEYP